MEKKCRYCELPAEGVLVYGYHDGTPIDIELVCSEHGTQYDNSAELASSGLAYYDDGRPYTYYHGRFDTDRYSY